MGLSKSKPFPNWFFYGFACNLLRGVPTYAALINLSAELLVSFISRKLNCMRSRVNPFGIALNVCSGEGETAVD